MIEEIIYRPAVLADIPLLARHHRLMFEEMRSLGDDHSPKDTCCSPDEQATGFPLPLSKKNIPFPPDFDRLEAAQLAKLEEQLAEGTCTAWIATCRNEPIASGGVTIIKTVPVPEDPFVETAFLHSVYTIPSMRGRGIASAILDRLLEHCRDKGLHRVQLNSSEVGRSVYQKKGFHRLERVMLRWL